MSENTEAAPVAATQPISMEEARARYSASKAAAKAPDAKDPSEAARILGKRAAEARAERQAQQAQPEEGAEAPEQQVEENSPNGAAQDETETGEQSSEAETVENESGEPQTIEIDGEKVSIDEVRDGFLRTADYTRKTQKLAEERKEFEAARVQRLGELDQNLNMLKQIMPQPKSLKQFLADDPVNGLAAFAEQNEAFEKLAHVFRAADETKVKARVESEAQRDKELANSYNTEWSDQTKRDKAYGELTAHALQLGASVDELRNMSVPGWVLKALDGARKYESIQADKSKVTKLVADKPKVIKPGVKATASSAAQGQAKNALTRLKSSGSMADAIALYRATKPTRR